MADAAPSTSPPPLPANAHEDKSYTVISVIIFCLIWSTAMVGMRLWTRGKMIKQFGMDDYACIVGLMTTYGSAIAIGHMTTFGLGRHVWVMKPADVPLYLRDFYISIVMYCCALLSLKLTFLFQYYRVLAVQHMRIVYLVAIFVVGGWALSQVLVGIFICTPIRAFWFGVQSIEGATCIPNIPQWYINAAGNILTDVAVFALPLPALWKLNLPRGQKYVLIGIFSLGFFTVIISIIRIKYLQLYEDFPWENVTSSLWSVGELTSAITCACLPTLRPFLVTYFPRLAAVIGGSRVTPTGAMSAGVAVDGAGRIRTVDPETGHHSCTRSGGKKGAAATVEYADGAGSEVELSPQYFKANPFEVHVIHKSESLDGVSVVSRDTR
ncbi:hypothetical protein QBC36DRAFT_390887 [Triangularia setosa]|uniref:Rhodopsin domain-containing protein n=1 Tax=Triangularia setosa TaxID=2587417 RepID=A0AAN7A399_9PEZI|nr:hypothetical protein QBC36DRAFT_390887 [Podospora setosa]